MDFTSETRTNMEEKLDCPVPPKYSVRAVLSGLMTGCHRGCFLLLQTHEYRHQLGQEPSECHRMHRGAGWLPPAFRQHILADQGIAGCPTASRRESAGRV